MKVREIFNLKFTGNRDICKWKRFKWQENVLIKRWSEIVKQRER